MGLFDRREGHTQTTEDPTFGLLEYHESGCWRGDVTFEPVGDEVGVEILTDGSVPGEEHRQLFSQLAERYESLVPALARELFRLYTAHATAEETAKLRSSEEMMSATELGWIEIRSGRDLRLGYGFRSDTNRGDGTFTIRLKDWSPQGEGFEE